MALRTKRRAKISDCTSIANGRRICGGHSYRLISRRSAAKSIELFMSQISLTTRPAGEPVAVHKRIMHSANPARARELVRVRMRWRITNNSDVPAQREDNSLDRAATVSIRQY